MSASPASKTANARSATYARMFRKPSALTDVRNRKKRRRLKHIRIIQPAIRQRLVDLEFHSQTRTQGTQPRKPTIMITEHVYEPLEQEKWEEKIRECCQKEDPDDPKGC